MSTYEERESRLKPAVFDKSGNHQIIDTSHKTFDRQVGGLTTGNIIDDVLLGSFIRSYNTTMCWGPKPFPPGHLRNYDLKNFGNLNGRVRQKVCDLTQDRDVILYEVRHWTRQRTRWGETEYVKHIHGYIITTTEYELLDIYVIGSQYYKSSKVLYSVAPYISWKEE